MGSWWALGGLQQLCLEIFSIYGGLCGDFQGGLQAGVFDWEFQASGVVGSGGAPQGAFGAPSRLLMGSAAFLGNFRVFTAGSVEIFRGFRRAPSGLRVGSWWAPATLLGNFQVFTAGSMEIFRGFRRAPSGLRFSEVSAFCFGIRGGSWWAQLLCLEIFRY